jgi:hypothetical protein
MHISFRLRTGERKYQAGHVRGERWDDERENNHGSFQ